MSGESEQLELLRAVARAVGATPGVTVKPVRLGRIYFAFRKTQTPGRAWQMVRALLRPFVLRFWRTPCDQVTVPAWLEHVAKRRREPTRSYRGGKKLRPGHGPPKASTLNLERIRAIQLMNFAVDSGMVHGHALGRTKPLKNGATIRQIQFALGHAQPETTLRYLRRARDQDAHAMAEIMAKRRGPRRAVLENSPGDAKEIVKLGNKSVTSFS